MVSEDYVLDHVLDDHDREVLDRPRGCRCPRHLRTSSSSTSSLLFEDLQLEVLVLEDGDNIRRQSQRGQRRGQSPPTPRGRGPQSDSVRIGRILSDSVRFGPIMSDSVRIGRIQSDSVRFGRILSDSVRMGRIRSDTVQYGLILSDSVRFGPIHCLHQPLS